MGEYTHEIMWFSIKHWVNTYDDLRRSGAFPLADQLREMLRRMGYQLKTGKDETTWIDTNRSYETPKYERI